MTAALALMAASALLYEQAVVKLLHERTVEDRISYVVIDAADGREVDARWPDVSTPVAPGSLVKPFLALAYGRAHHGQFPEFTCRRGCWLPRGHGRLGIAEAIAQSCNSYFGQLAAATDFAELTSTAEHFALPAPPSHRAAWFGRDPRWTIAPLELARAYAKLLSDPEAATVLEGMAGCARHGTARALGQGLAKTGTAAGDGFTLAVDRADQPRYVLLVRVCGVPGAVAAESAAALMRVIREGQ